MCRHKGIADAFFMSKENDENNNKNENRIVEKLRRIIYTYILLFCVFKVNWEFCGKVRCIRNVNTNSDLLCKRFENFMHRLLQLEYIYGRGY